MTTARTALRRDPDPLRTLQSIEIENDNARRFPSTAQRSRAIGAVHPPANAQIAAAYRQTVRICARLDLAPEQAAEVLEALGFIPTIPARKKTTRRRAA
ncbi:hypothetical protein [Spongiactinospora sp. TRM90649]|uniref:hypothetical protein n=1 Tax=Spongiactinospora sp. TRM90649 TaxID=3031114 RepID=UPI0023FA0423|nr:hypothetical protein [Spongiactinospora sp. TRM90649]MDF5755796.1 hypothetical protein [Spongiactinospora sp. TRM90649]